MKARTFPKRGPGRPKGRRQGAAIRTRLPPELEFTARSACKLLGISMSRFIRAGLEGALADLIPKLVEIVEDSKTDPARCLRLMEFLRDISRASLALHQPMPYVEASRDAAVGLPQIPEIRIRRPDAALRRFYTSK